MHNNEGIALTNFQQQQTVTLTVNFILDGIFSVNFPVSVAAPPRLFLRWFISHFERQRCQDNRLSKVVNSRQTERCRKPNLEVDSANAHLILYAM